MRETLAILVSFLAVLGLYALFSRLVVWLLPRASLSVIVCGEGKTVEEILRDVHLSRLLIEREGRFSERVLVLLDGTDQEKINALRKEGILICTQIK